MPRILDLGCGDAKTPGTLGFDARPLPGVDVVGDCRSLPFRDEAFDVIFCFHVIEHFTKPDALKVLRDAHRTLCRNGQFYLACPDMVAMARSYLHYEQIGNWSEMENLTHNYYGGQTYDLNHHFWGYSWRPLASLLSEAGFTRVQRMSPRDMHEILVESTKQ